MLVGDASNQANPVTITGDITIATDGTVTITNASISTNMLQNNAVTTNKIAADAVARRNIAPNVAGDGLGPGCQW